MKERPILFSGEMVRAILAGTKTQTRREIKPQPMDEYTKNSHISYDADGNCIWWQTPGPMVMAAAKNKYGQPGDKLWVKETWATSRACDDRPPSDMEKPGRGYGWPVWYRADGSVNTRRADPVPQGGPGFTTMGKWRPSIFMPRWASRITLEIAAIRVERLQAISEADARAEGVKCIGLRYEKEASTAYAELWEKINGVGSWALNPWVRVIEFKALPFVQASVRAAKAVDVD